MSQFPFEQLPPELRREVMSHLSDRDAASLSLTSRAIQPEVQSYLTDTLAYYRSQLEELQTDFARVDEEVFGDRVPDDFEAAADAWSSIKAKVDQLKQSIEELSGYVQSIT